MDLVKFNPIGTCQITEIEQSRVDGNRIRAMSRQERESKHENMYAFESMFGSSQMNDILAVLEFVR